MAAFEGRSGVRECSWRVRQAGALQLHVRRLGLRQGPSAHPQVVTSEIGNRPVEREKFARGCGVHLAAVVGESFVKNGGRGPTQ